MDQDAQNYEGVFNKRLYWTTVLIQIHKTRDHKKISIPKLCTLNSKKMRNQSHLLNLLSFCPVGHVSKVFCGYSHHAEVLVM